MAGHCTAGFSSELERERERVVISQNQAFCSVHVNSLNEGTLFADVSCSSFIVSQLFSLLILLPEVRPFLYPSCPSSSFSGRKESSTLSSFSPSSD